MTTIMPDIRTKPLDFRPVTPYLYLVLMDLPPRRSLLAIKSKPVTVLLQSQFVVVEFAFVGAEIACAAFLCDDNT